MTADKIILGIDPGTAIMGYGIIQVKKNKLFLITYGVIELRKIKNHPDKLKRIFERTKGLIEEYCPDEMAIEAPFFGKNVQSMLKLGRAQGVCIAASLSRDVPYEEYTPRRIKQALTGKGSSSKIQVAMMVQRLVGLEEIPKELDATDGLAVAICHHYSHGRGENNKTKSNTWKAYISQNPGRDKSPKKKS